MIGNLKKKCYDLVDTIMRSGAISKKDLFFALSIRLNIPIDKCYIRDFDEEMLKKAIKELEIMIKLNL